MLVKDRLGSPFNDFRLESDIRYPYPHIGLDSVIEEMEIVASDDANPDRPRPILQLLSEGLFVVACLLYPDLPEQNKQVDFTVQSQILHILIQSLLIESTKAIPVQQLRPQIYQFYAQLL
jgi:hypothetical protein